MVAVVSPAGGFFLCDGAHLRRRSLPQLPDGRGALRSAVPRLRPCLRRGKKRNARQCRPLSSSARRPASLRPATASSSGLRLLRRLPVGSVACAPPIGAAARPSLGGSSGLASPRFAPACGRWRLSSSGRSPCGGLPLRPAAGCVPRPCGAAGSALHPLRGSGCVPRSAFLSSPRLRRLRFACPRSSVAAACAACRPLCRLLAAAPKERAPPLPPLKGGEKAVPHVVRYVLSGSASSYSACLPL